MDTKNDTYKIIFTNDAIKDMTEVLDYISENLYSPDAARKLMREIDNSIENLKYMPYSFRVIKKYDELKLKYRRIIIKKYVVIYTIDENKKQVYIINIYYGKSNYFTKI